MFYELKILILICFRLAQPTLQTAQRFSATLLNVPQLNRSQVYTSLLHKNPANQIANLNINNPIVQRPRKSAPTIISKTPTIVIPVRQQSIIGKVPIPAHQSPRSHVIIDSPLLSPHSHTNTGLVIPSRSPVKSIFKHHPPGSLPGHCFEHSSPQDCGPVIDLSIKKKPVDVNEDKPTDLSVRNPFNSTSPISCNLNNPIGLVRVSKEQKDLIQKTQKKSVIKVQDGGEICHYIFTLYECYIV